ncbi:lytic polysaccharide monooxygenase [Paenibacillus sp. N1-5-1-14]|uniref:lytic polysaccharide monooxygenase n=1 Tax=Paenibacillus radicibacter TaxID=2972488 RepID=UPI0021593BA8|nr:lytic polysaccharide monooxygenase [Paenibacillus radicibacter]MCR8643470.1 lytic polysaccharide monooxygenase [Paenibacillus radicibacter]
MFRRLQQQFTKSKEGTNTSKRLRRIATPLALVCGIIGSLSFAGLASAHGYVEAPTSRTILCNKGINTGCGPIQYEPQSVEGPKGFPNGGPGDGKIAGAGRYPDLDVQTADRWKKVDMNGGTNTFTWYNTARHATSKWEYYITKKGWNPNQALKGSDFELLATFSGGNQQPAQRVAHDVQIPTDRSGYYIILSVWEISDTANSFYQVIDVNLKNDGNPPVDQEAPSVPAGVGSTAQTTNSVSLKWNASTDNVGVHHYELYRNGAKVTNVTGTTYTDSGLQANTSYTYAVTAVDAAGNVSAKSASIQVTTKDIPAVDTEAPSIPTTVHSMGETPSTIDLMWNPSTDNVGVHHYDVYRNNVKVTSVSGTSYMDTGLQADTSYTYTVTAVDAAGNASAQSAAFTVKTKPSSSSTLPEWDATKVYVGGDKVQYQGKEYAAQWWTQGEKPDTSSAWKLLNGATQEWNATKAYNGGDRVTYQGVTYEAKWWTKGETPGTATVWKVV